MPQIIPLGKIIFTTFLLSFILLSKIPLVKAEVIFSDSFSGGYSDSWQVAPGRLSPIPSTHGIAAASSTEWSDIIIPINESAVYNVQFDLWINIGSVNSVWRLYMIDNTYTTWANYKIINNWGPDNLLQVSERFGINVLNPWNHNPGLHHFEIVFSPLGDTDITVIEDGVQITKIRSQSEFDMTYMGVGLLGYGDNEMSNFVLSRENSEPTPTPTPDPIDTVVIVPGLGGSWNKDALVNCKDEGYSGDWILTPYFGAQVYGPLYESIENIGISTAPYYYDWRKQVVNHTGALANFINDLTTESEKVHLVGHSMGGLVSRAYLEEQGNNNKVEKLLTVGSPHAGSALSYPAWSGGEIWNGPLEQRMAMTLLINRCNAQPTANDRETIRSHIPSVQNILPITDYLLDHSNGSLKPVASMNAQNNWLPTLFEPPFFGVTLGTLSGRGEKTLETIEVRDPNRRDENYGNWKDGKPLKRNETTEGDGTVLVSSSQIPGADNRLIEEDHGGLVSSPEGISQIHDFLGFSNANAPLTTSQQPTSAFVIIANPGIFWLESPNGEVRQGKAGLAAFLNPQKGTYKLRLIPTNTETLVLVGQFLPNGNYSWKEYKLKNILPKFSTINFDPGTILENPLE